MEQIDVVLKICIERNNKFGYKVKRILRENYIEGV